MGRKNKSYSKTLHQQAYDRLTSMQAFGQSKKEAVAAGTDKDRVFSFGTYQTYWKHTKYFLRYVQEKHPECTTLKKAKGYVNEWLQARTDQGLSAWTIQTEAKALGKLYGIGPEDPDYFRPPQRHRAEITRSRGDKVRDLHFSKTNNDELIKFCQGTGLRRSELEALRGSDLITRAELELEITRIEQIQDRSPADDKYLGVLRDAKVFDADYYTHVRSGKGGRERISPIIGDHVGQIVERMRHTEPEGHVWQYVHKAADIHGYRGDYATAIYKAHARPINEIPFDKVHPGTGRAYQGDVYVCRKDEAGKRLDRAAMQLCSKALGHNRVEVVANNYIRSL